MSEISTYPNEEEYEINKAVNFLEGRGRVVLSAESYDKMHSAYERTLAAEKSGNTCKRCGRGLLSTEQPQGVCVNCYEHVAAHKTPDDLRAEGWRVAVHNDYRTSVGDYTFWLFTKPLDASERGIFYAIKGEGEDDPIALSCARAAAKRLASLRINPGEASQLGHERDRLAAQVNEWREAHARLQQEVLDLRKATVSPGERGTVVQLTAQIDQLNALLDGWKEDHAKVQRERTKACTERDTLLKAFELERSTLHNKINELKGSLRQSEATRTQLQAANTGTQYTAELVKTLQAEVDELQKSNDALHDGVEKALGLGTQSATDWKAECAKLRAAHGALNQNYIDLADAHARSERRYIVAAAEVNALRSALEESIRARVEFQALATTRNVEISQLHATVEELRKTPEKAPHVTDEIIQRIHELEGQLDMIHKTYGIRCTSVVGG